MTKSKPNRNALFTNILGLLRRSTLRPAAAKFLTQNILHALGLKE